MKGPKQPVVIFFDVPMEKLADTDRICMKKLKQLSLNMPFHHGVLFLERGERIECPKDALGV